MHYWCINAKYNGMELQIKIIDNHDGTYDVSYIPIASGTVVVTVAYDDPVQGSVIPIRGSPWNVAFDNPWTKIKKVEGTAPKAHNGMQCTALQKKVVFYGGGPGVHVLDSDNMKWESPELEGDAPKDRVQHSLLTLDNEKILITGGKTPVPLNEDGTEGDDSNLPKADFDGVHLLMCEKGVWKWAPNPEVHGDKPAPIARHSTCLIPVGKKVVCFGGLGSDGTRTSDLRVLTAQNLAKMDWVQVPKHVPEPSEEPAVEDGEVPPAEGEKDAIAKAQAPLPAAEAPAEAEGETGGAPGKEGGREGQEEDEGEKPPPALTAPGDRIGSGTAFVDGHVYLFGGNATHDDGQRIFTNVLTLGTFEGNAKTFEKGSVEVAWKNIEVSANSKEADLF